MMKLRKHFPTGAALLGFGAALLPLGLWYGRRMTDGSDEPLGVLALVAALGVAGLHRDVLRTTSAQQALGLLLLAVYGSTVWLGFPPLLRALPALAAVACWTGLWRLPSATLLLGLSLPVMASLQFYLGFPMRVTAAEVSHSLLKLLSVPVERVGTQLLYQGATIGVDAPCSGIRMLWMSCFFAAILGGMLRLRWRGSLCLLVSAGLIAILANALRATLLFFPESEILHLPSWAHEGTGLVLHILAMAALLTLARKISPPSCALP